MLPGSLTSLAALTPLNRVPLTLCCLLILTGCVFSSGNGNSSQPPRYDSFGNWPQYSGEWKSITNAAGGKHARWTYLDITIRDDGTFAGRYSSYQYDYTYHMATHMGTIPVQVYNPSGRFRELSGALDFDAGTGIATFVGMDEVRFSIDRISKDELTLRYPSHFHYTTAYIGR